MKQHYKFITTFLFLILQLPLLGNTGAVELFTKANSAYQKKDFQAAISGYEEIIKQGYKSEIVYFNLGNSYYKVNNISKAILNFERAKAIQPFDEDIQFNLRMAYAGTVDKIEPIPLLFYQRWWESFLHLFSPGIWSTIAVSLIWMTFLLGLAYLFAKTVNAKRNTFLSMLGLLLLSAFVYFVSYSSNKSLNGTHGAIITEATAYIKSSPDTKSTNLFMLHEGTKIEVTDEIQGWKKIKIANGNVGWIEDGKLELI